MGWSPGPDTQWAEGPGAQVEQGSEQGAVNFDWGFWSLVVAFIRYAASPLWFAIKDSGRNDAEDSCRCMGEALCN